MCIYSYNVLRKYNVSDSYNLLSVLPEYFFLYLNYFWRKPLCFLVTFQQKQVDF